MKVIPACHLQQPLDNLVYVFQMEKTDAEEAVIKYYIYGGVELAGLCVHSVHCTVYTSSTNSNRKNFEMRNILTLHKGKQFVLLARGGRRAKLLARIPGIKALCPLSLIFLFLGLGCIIIIIALVFFYKEIVTHIAECKDTTESDSAVKGIPPSQTLQ